MILTDRTIETVRHAICALRKINRLHSLERDALLIALQDAETELRSCVEQEYPDLMQWRIPAPTYYRRHAGGWCAWKSASQLCRAAESWLERGPSYAAARAAQAYGISATLAGTNIPVLAVRDHTGR